VERELTGRRTHAARSHMHTQAYSALHHAAANGGEAVGD
jgi:hypothetical protein